jgi:hypothetical protein
MRIHYVLALLLTLALINPINSQTVPPQQIEMNRWLHSSKTR